MNNIELENNLSNEKSLEKEQISFLQTSIGKAVNTGLNIGIRYLLPDVIENEIIEIKDTLIRDGIKEGVQTAIDSAVNLGKSALGIITGNFENIQQMQTAVKSGGIIDSISDVINSTINKVVERDKNKPATIKKIFYKTNVIEEDESARQGEIHTRAHCDDIQRSDEGAFQQSSPTPVLRQESAVESRT